MGFFFFFTFILLHLFGLFVKLFLTQYRTHTHERTRAAVLQTAAAVFKKKKKNTITFPGRVCHLFLLTELSDVPTCVNNSSYNTQQKEKEKGKE